MNKKQFKAITKWQKKTFKTAVPESVLMHLKDEIIELEKELFCGDRQNIKSEFADCFILLFGAAKLRGFDYKDICKMIDKKFDIIQKRTWNKPDENNIVKHKK